MMYAGLIAVIGLVAMNTQNNLLFWALGVLAAGLLLSIVLSWMMLSRVRVRRLDPQHGAVGEPLLVRYRMTNLSRLFPAFNVHCEEVPVNAKGGRWALLRGESGRDESEPSAKPWQKLMAPARAWLMHAAARETTHAEAVYWPTGRGMAKFDRVHLWTTFPFGIIRRSVTLSQEHHTLIFPRLHELRRDVLHRVTPAGLLGMRMTQRSGPGEEYFGVREYRSGDSLRHISWKRTARLDELVTIERSRPSPPKLRVVLNLSRATAELRLADNSIDAKRAAEEEAISLAASILYAADLAGYEIGLSVVGFDLPRMPLRRSRWHLSKMLGSLASIDLDAARLSNAAATIPAAERAGLVLIHPDRVDPTLAREDAWHLTSAQLATFSTGVLGWDPAKMQGEPAARADSARLQDEMRNKSMSGAKRAKQEASS